MPSWRNPKYELLASRAASGTTDFATTDLTGGFATQKFTRCAVQVMVFTAASMHLMTYYGASSEGSSLQQLNSDTALTAGVLYGFIHMVHGSQSFNYRFGSGVTVKTLLVEEFAADVE